MHLVLLRTVAPIDLLPDHVIDVHAYNAFIFVWLRHFKFGGVNSGCSIYKSRLVS